jgi:L-rhamnose mutarotase
MARVALHTVLTAGAEDRYDELHAVVPAELATALREHGVQDWQIWRDGQDVFHLVDVEDYAAMRDGLRDHPVNVAWQAAVGPLFDRADSYAGDDSGLRPVWRLTEQVG